MESDVMGELDAFLHRNPDVEFVDAMFPDMCGIIRGKRLTPKHAKTLYAEGLQVPGSMLLLSVTGNCMDPLGRGVSDGDPDVVIRPIAGSLRRIPWSTRPGAQVQVSVLNAQGGGNDFDPRHILWRVARRFDELGLQPVVAGELEFCLIDRDAAPDGSPQRPALTCSGRKFGDTQLMSLASIDEFGSFGHEVTEVSRALEIPLTALNAEYGGGQFEMNLHHVASAVQAADDAVSLKQIVQGVATRHGMQATFMAKPYADRAGSGMHWHMSLLNAKGQNIFDENNQRGAEALQHAVAGVLATLPEAMAFVAPNINSYKRFKPGLFVPMTRTWGYNNRSVAVRIPGGASGDRRIEYRIPGADANPYLALAVLLAGVHHGIAAKLKPSLPHDGNASTIRDPGMPLTLYDALNALRLAKVIPDYLGRDYCEVYAECKRLEMEEFLSDISAREFSWYLRPDF
ncbi:MAG: glutamine synthetase family protein [Woeseia sp.]